MPRLSKVSFLLILNSLILAPFAFCLYKCKTMIITPGIPSLSSAIFFQSVYFFLRIQCVLEFIHISDCLSFLSTATWLSNSISFLMSASSVTAVLIGQVFWFTSYLGKADVTDFSRIDEVSLSPIERFLLSVSHKGNVCSVLFVFPCKYIGWAVPFKS